jgi:hypothetical protein
MKTVLRTDARSAYIAPSSRTVASRKHAAEWRAFHSAIAGVSSWRSQQKVKIAQSASHEKACFFATS